MAMPMFSIVVPCYNVEPYLNNCIDSVIKQSYIDFEVLLINDGSTDGTLDVCKIWEKSDERIHVINKTNEGLSLTRNLGIKEAHGKYIVFLDGDDYLESKALEEIFNVIQEDTEIIITRLIEDFGDTIIIKDKEMKSYFDSGISAVKGIQWVMNKTDNTWPSVKYIVSKEYLQAHRLEFKAGYIHEDMDWTSNLFAFANNIAVCYYPWYHHRMQRKGSITNVISSKRITDVIEMAYDIIEGSDSNIRFYSDECRQLVIDRIMMSTFGILIKYKYLKSKKDKKAVVECSKKYRTIFRYQPKRKFKVFMAVVNIFGFQMALELCSLVLAIINRGN